MLGQQHFFTKNYFTFLQVCFECSIRLPHYFKENTWHIDLYGGTTLLCFSLGFFSLHCIKSISSLLKLRFLFLEGILSCLWTFNTSCDGFIVTGVDVAFFSCSAFICFSTNESKNSNENDQFSCITGCSQSHHSSGCDNTKSVVSSTAISTCCTSFILVIPFLFITLSNLGLPLVIIIQQKIRQSCVAVVKQHIPFAVLLSVRYFGKYESFPCCQRSSTLGTTAIQERMCKSVVLLEISLIE